MLPIPQANSELRAVVVARRVEFVLTELDTAIVFCEVALTTRSPETRARNIKNALEGYRVAVRFSEMREVDMMGDPTFRDKVGKLKVLLHRLSPKFYFVPLRNGKFAEKPGSSQS